jgi:hypothetical protein
VDILKQINEKASELSRKAQKLTEIEIVWGSPIVIDCNELTNLENIKSDKRFIFFNSINKVPVIYYFIIKSKIESNIVVHHLNI